MNESPAHLDCRNLLCPLPVIRTQERIGTMAAGDTLVVTSTDPGVIHDIPSWCRVHGHEVHEITEQGREIIITIHVK